jgi:hypothetical protein
LAEDRLGLAAGDANPYRYVFNNPVRYTDPAGELPVAVAGCVIGGALGAAGGVAGLYLGGQASVGLDEFVNDIQQSRSRGPARTGPARPGQSPNPCPEQGQGPTPPDDQIGILPPAEGPDWVDYVATGALGAVLGCLGGIQVGVIGGTAAGLIFSGEFVGGFGEGWFIDTLMP